MSSPWSRGSDPNSIWNSNSPNLNLLRRYSLRSPATSVSVSGNDNNALGVTNNHHHLSCGAHTTLSSSCVVGASGIQNATVSSNIGLFCTLVGSKSKCSWEPSADGKYLIGYIVISKQDLEIYHSSLGIQVCGGKPTHDGQFGAIVEHVVPGSLMNIVCKLKVGDEIVEWNGHDLRNKQKEEVKQIIESTKKTAAINCFIGNNNLAPGIGSCSNIIGNHSVQQQNSTQLRLVAVRLVNNNNNNSSGSGGNNNNNNNNNTNNSNSNSNNSGAGGAS